LGHVEVSGILLGAFYPDDHSLSTRKTIPRVLLNCNLVCSAEVFKYITVHLFVSSCHVETIEVVVIDIEAVVIALEALFVHLVGNDTHDLPDLLVPRSVLKLKPDAEAIVIHGVDFHVFCLVTN
jgi:hypothetical protein